MTRVSRCKVFSSIELYCGRTAETVSFASLPQKETSKPSNVCMRGGDAFPIGLAMASRALLLQVAAILCCSSFA